MPKDKDLKRIVRSRMQKTGESYTAARARILAKTPPPADPGSAEAPAAGSEDHGAVAGMSDDAVRAKTGRDWAEWVAVLDAVDAVSRPHREIARHLAEEHGVAAWWSQMVTVGYERIRGLRDVGQRRDGGYEINKSKTVPVPVARLYRALDDPAEREHWLPGVELTVRTAIAGKSMRITWEDGTWVDAYFTAEGDHKSRLAIQHRKLATREDADRRRSFWSERLARLAEILAPPTSRRAPRRGRRAAAPR